MTPYEHLRLLQRFERLDSLARILRQTVEPGDQVLDAGCGMGLLTMWAAQAGGLVTAVDLGNVEIAEQLVRANGLGAKVTFHQADLLEFARDADQRARFDVLIGMLYLNDPRRDEQQSQLVQQLRQKVLKPGGTTIPDRVEYSAALCQWPAQQWPHRAATIDEQVTAIESRYGLKLAPLRSAILAAVDKQWFPPRDASGQVAREEACRLSPLQHQFDVIYTDQPPAYPERLAIVAETRGMADVVIWRQRLMFGEAEVFCNESLTWVTEPIPVEPGATLVAALDDEWRRTNRVRLSR